MSSSETEDMDQISFMDRCETEDFYDRRRRVSVDCVNDFEVATSPSHNKEVSGFLVLI